MALIASIANSESYASIRSKLNALIGFANSIPLGVVELITTSRALTLADNGKILRYDGSTPLVVTVPGTLPEGFSVAISRWGTGTVTIAVSGSTNRSAVTAVSAQYKMLSLLVKKNNVGVTAAEFIVAEAG